MWSRILLVLWIWVNAGPVQAEQTSLVSVRPLKELTYHPERSAPATVVSLNQSTISSRLDAQVLSIPVLVGDHVAQGQVLVQLDCADYHLDLRAAQAHLKSAQARLQLAETQLERFSRLLEQNLASREDRDARAADRDALAADSDAAHAGLDRAQLAVERCDVRAPFPGLVSERLVAEGQLVSPGTELIGLVDRNNIELSAQINVGDAGYLDRSTSFVFRAGDHWPAVLRSRLDVINPVTRSQEVRLTFEGGHPLPGAAGKLVWLDARRFVPARYVTSREGRLGLFLAVGGQAEFWPLENVQPGRDSQIPATMDMDSRIVVAGLNALQHGEAIEIDDMPAEAR